MYCVTLDYTDLFGQPPLECMNEENYRNPDTNSNVHCYEENINVLPMFMHHLL